MKKSLKAASVRGLRLTLSQAEGGNPPETEKMFSKNGVICEGSIFGNKFSKIKIK